MVSVTRKMWPGKDPDFNIKQYHNKIINMYIIYSGITFIHGGQCLGVVKIFLVRGDIFSLVVWACLFRD